MEAVPEYRQGDIVGLRVTVQDPSGVQAVYATATRVESASIPEQNPEDTVDPGRSISLRLEGAPEGGGPEPKEVTLRARVTNQAPGEYICREIQAFDMLDQESFHPLHPPRRLRITGSLEEDREGPSVLDVGDFE